MFHLAATKGHANLAKFFHDKFSHKAELLVNDLGEHPLHISVKCNHYEFTKALLEVLKENGPKNKKQETPLHLAVMENNYELVELLMKYVKDKSPKDVKKRVPLHYAAMKGDLQILQLFQGENFDAADKYGYLPIHYAVKEGHYQVIEYMCSKTQNLQSVTFEKESVLHLTAMKGNIEIMKILLSHKLDKNRQNSNGKTPLHEAICHNNTEIALLLIQDPEVQVNFLDELDSTPLHLAAMAGKVEVIKALVSRPEVDIYAQDFQKNCALHVAVKNGHFEAFQFLFEHYKNRDLPKDENQKTPLHLAASCGHYRIVKSILDQRPEEVMPRDRWRNTPLHYAAEEGHLEVVKLLLHQAKEKMPLNNSGYCPFDLARTYGKKDVAKYISSYLGEDRVKIFDNRFKRPKETSQSKFGYKQF